MNAPSAENASSSEAFPLQLNPYLLASLPEIKNDLLSAVNDCEIKLDQAAMRIGQLLDLVRYEIDKIDQRIKTLEWESKVDREQLADLTTRSVQLKSLVERFPPVSAQASIISIRGLVDVIRGELESFSAGDGGDE